MSWELLAGLVVGGAAAAIYWTGWRRRRQEAEAAARDMAALQAANEAHQRRMDALLRPGLKDGQ
jgi:type II secretory pathway pseudopilin PulG